MSARMLRKDPLTAQEGARQFLDILEKGSRNKPSHYEEAWINDPVKMEQLRMFCDLEVPVLLWHMDGAFKDIFRFLAQRFLSSPDSVLPCEGVHAQWKWIELIKRGISFVMINCFLKLNNYMQFYGCLPDYDELLPHIKLVRESLQAQLAAVVSEGRVARGMRASWIYQDRFNLNVMDIDLIKETLAGQRGLPSTATHAWGMYVRFLFRPQTFYGFIHLSSQRYLMVIENKSLPGRAEIAEGEALGRFLSVAWFEKTDATMDGFVVQPVGGG